MLDNSVFSGRREFCYDKRSGETAAISFRLSECVDFFSHCVWFRFRMECVFYFLRWRFGMYVYIFFSLSVRENESLKWYQHYTNFFFSPSPPHSKKIGRGGGGVFTPLKKKILWNKRIRETGKNTHFRSTTKKYRLVQPTCIQSAILNRGVCYVSARFLCVASGYMRGHLPKALGKPTGHRRVIRWPISLRFFLFSSLFLRLFSSLFLVIL